MEYVDGEPLLAHLARTPSPQAALRLFLKICDAIQYAHANLIIHRDLKPQNILVTPAGEPKILDFGIAKLLDDSGHDGAVTIHRAFSLDYASPEQIRGQAINTASDIFSLGLVLYEMASGSRARQWKDKSHEQQFLESAQFEVPPHPRIGPDLFAIIRQAAHPDPALRYPTVSSLADDVERLLTGRPVIARPLSPAQLLWRFLRRHRLPVAVATTVAAIILGLALQSRFSAQRALAALALAEANRLSAVNQQAAAERERARAEEQSRLLALALTAQKQQTELARNMQSRATLEREKAERHLRQLLALYGSLTTTNQSEISKLTGGLATAVRLSSNALAQLERLETTPATRTDSLLLRAIAHAQLAELYWGPNGNLGDAAKGAEHRANALKIFTTLHRENPGSVEFTARYLSAAFMDQIRRQKGLSTSDYRDWEQRFLQLERAAQPSRAITSEIARFYFSASLRQGEKDYAAVLLQARQQSLVYYRKVLAQADATTRPQDLRNVALILKYLANVSTLPPETRLSHAAEAVTIDRQRVVLQPANFEARLDLAFSIGALGDAHLLQKRYAEAISAYRESTTLRQQAARLDPANVFVLRSQFYPVLQWAWAAAVANSNPELQAALAAFTDAAAIAKPPASPLILARINGFRGILTVRQGQPETGCPMLRAATAALPPQDPYRMPVDTVLAACPPAQPANPQPINQ
jgi:hypothetical protein